jgi:NTE family protein
MTSRALVLGGGGLAGIAWELALLIELTERGLFEAADADLVIGTSAGSVIGAVLTTGLDLRELLESQIDDPTGGAELSGDFDMNDMATQLMSFFADGPSPDELRKRIGNAALRADTVDESVRREVIEARLPVKAWPQTPPLVITAIEAETGEFVTFDRHSGVGLVDAVAASCAVPLVWPPMTIAGRRYIDGGLRTTTNADIAAGHDRVLVLAPFPPIGPPMGATMQDEIDEIEAKGGAAYVVAADEASVAAFGMNPLDASTRRPSALAGTAQADVIADDVIAFWKD